MNGQLTAVAYHYVRDTDQTRFPDIKGLAIRQFRGQLDYIKKHYNVISAQALLAFASGVADAIPPRAVLLTFDDGLIDHYRWVAPILGEYDISGAFFPPARAIVERDLLDVHKVHFILAAERDKHRIATELQSLIEEHRAEYGLESCETYIDRWAKAGRYGDPAEVIFVKRMLQKGLPGPARTKIADTLFERIVNVDQRSFADEIYVTTEQLREMREAGLYVGGHGYDHSWLNTLSTEAQNRDVAGMLDFLHELGVAEEPWMITYPHGAHDDNLILNLSSHGCLVGFDVAIGIADFACDRLMALPRLDANHLPTEACAANDWTLRIIG